MKTAHGTDSQGRAWIVTMALDGMVVLTPNGHDTDPDSDALSMADEAALMDLVLPPDADASDEGEEDPRYLAYDRRRDAYEDARAGVG